MKNRLRAIIKTRHLFIYLLPVFFILHRFTDNYGLVNVKDALVILLIYIIAAFTISHISYRFLKDKYKGDLFCFSLLFINFFFGVMVDWINRNAKGTFLTSYYVLIPTTFLLVLLIVLLLKRKNQISHRPGTILNTFLLLLIIVDLGWLVLKIGFPATNYKLSDPVMLKPFEAKGQPDIYMIIADAYAGKTELKDIFNYDNSDFENQLTKRGFHIIKDSKSNYNYSVLSIGSLLNLSYLKLKKDDLKDNLMNGIHAIQKASLLTYLRNSGYMIENFSDFKTNSSSNDDNTKKNVSLSGGYQLLINTTLVYYLKGILHFQFAEKRKLRFFDWGETYRIQKSNEINYNETIEFSKTISDSPRFIYTHLLMPHYPYYFDRNGNSLSFGELQDRYSQKNYIEYLLYANKKLIELVDEIKKNSKVQPVIILMSDHGFRQFKKPVDKKYYFNNLSSISLPDSNYSKFYTGMSLVNMFRTFVNVQFKENLPMLKDTSYYIDR